MNGHTGTVRRPLHLQYNPKAQTPPRVTKDKFFLKGARDSAAKMTADIKRKEKLAAKKTEKKPETLAPVVVVKRHSGAGKAIAKGAFAGFVIAMQTILPLKFNLEALADWINSTVPFAPIPVSTTKGIPSRPIMGWNEASAQQITPEMVAAWIKEKRETRANRDWRNAPFVNGAKFGFGRDPPGARYNTLGASDSLGQTILLLDMKDIFNELGVRGNTKFAKIVLLNKLEDGTHVYLLADAGMKGAVILSMISNLNEKNTPMTSIKLPFALSDDFYTIELTGQGAVIIDNKNNKAIFVPVNAAVSGGSYDIQFNGAKSDAVVIDDHRFAVIYGNKLTSVNVNDKTRGGTFDITEDVKVEPQSSEMKIIVSSVASSGTAMLVIDAPEWQKMYVYFLGADGTLELKGTWSKAGLTLGKL